MNFIAAKVVILFETTKLLPNYFLTITLPLA